MIAIIDDASNTLSVIVESTDGYDLTGKTLVTLPEGIPSHRIIWDGIALVERPNTDAEQAKANLQLDAVWAMIQAATPAQINAWLETNISGLNLATLDNIRKVLLVLLLKIKADNSD